MPTAAPALLRDGSRTDASTKERLLDAAERLLAETGIEALSTRAVTQAAGLSVSAVNYHFGTKDALVRAALLRALGPLGPERVARLDALEAAAGRAGEAVSVERLVEAFVRPSFDQRSRDGARSYRLLWGRLMLGTSGVAEEVRRDLMESSVPRYVDALARALPDRDRDGLAFAFQLALGTTLHVLGLDAALLAGVAPLDDETLIDRIARFTAAGIRSSATSKGGEGGR